MSVFMSHPVCVTVLYLLLLTLNCMHYFIARCQIRCYRTVTLRNRGLIRIVRFHAACVHCVCSVVVWDAAEFQPVSVYRGNYNVHRLHLLVMCIAAMQNIRIKTNRYSSYLQCKKIRAQASRHNHWRHNEVNVVSALKLVLNITWL